MNKPRIYVDFNELVDMVNQNVVLLSKEDRKIDSEGNEIIFTPGQKVFVYMPDVDENGKNDNLIADGVAEVNTLDIEWTKAAKWLCRIDKNGIRHESDVQNI